MRYLFLAVALFAVPAFAQQPLTEPVLFNTKEADAIVSKMQIMPKDNPWNADVSNWPVHKNSSAIVASIGVDKPLRYAGRGRFTPAPAGASMRTARPTAEKGGLA